MRALNDAKNYAQQGCAMQFDGITLTKKRSLIQEVVAMRELTVVYAE